MEGQLICITSPTIFQARSGCQVIKQMLRRFGLELMVTLLVLSSCEVSQFDLKWVNSKEQEAVKQYVRNHERAQCSIQHSESGPVSRQASSAGFKAPESSSITFLHRFIFLQITGIPGHGTPQGRGMIRPHLPAQLEWARKAALQAIGTAATLLAPG